MSHPQPAKEVKPKQKSKQKYVRRFYSTASKPKPNQKWDSEKKQFYDFGVDMFVTTKSGKRKRVRVHGFSTEAEATKAAAKLITDNLNGKVGIAETIEATPLEELFERHKKSIRHKKEKVRAERVFDAFLELTKQANVEDVKQSHFKAYIEQREDDGVQPQTINREITIISAALKKANEYFDSLEDWQCPKIIRPKFSEVGRERIITDDEQKKILDYLSGPKRDSEKGRDYRERIKTGIIFKVLLLTGARPGEIYSLRKSDVDFGAKTVRIFATKTESYRYVPFESTLENILKDAIKQSKSDFIFTANGQQPPRLYKYLRAACMEFSIPFGAQTTGGLCLYDTRHTFATNLLRQGADIATVKHLLGHTREYMTLHYSHASLETMREAIKGREKRIGKKKLSDDEIIALCQKVIDGIVSPSELVEIIKAQ